MDIASTATALIIAFTGATGNMNNQVRDSVRDVMREVPNVRLVSGSVQIETHNIINKIYYLSYVHKKQPLPVKEAVVCIMADRCGQKSELESLSLYPPDHSGLLY